MQVAQHRRVEFHGEETAEEKAEESQHKTLRVAKIRTLA